MTRTKTKTQVRTRTEFDQALRQVQLSAEEEKVLRMRFGVSAGDDLALEFRGEEQPEVRFQLADMERRAVQGLQTATVDAGRRDSIIERMRRL